MSSSAWSKYPTQTLASVVEAQGNDTVKSVTSNLMTQDHKAISLKGGLPVSVHAIVY